MMYRMTDDLKNVPYWKMMPAFELFNYLILILIKFLIVQTFCKYIHSDDKSLIKSHFRSL